MTTTQLVLIPGAHASGVDVSGTQRSWQYVRPGALTMDDFPTVTGNGVSAGGRRT